MQLESDPPGAAVLRDGRVLGRTPFRDTVPAGEAIYTLRRQKYRDTVVTVTGIEPGKVTTPEQIILRFDNPPRAGQEWTNSLEMLFDPRPDGHISRRAVSFDQYEKVQSFSRGGIAREYTQGDAFIPMVYGRMEDIQRFCTELTQRETLAGWLTEDLCYRPEPYTPRKPEEAKKMREAKPPGQTCFRLVVEKYGTVEVTSEPAGAEIYSYGVRKGTTPWQSARQRTGALEFRLVLPGYREGKITGTLNSGGNLTLNAKLKKSRQAVFGKDWENSLGIPFRPISSDVSLLAAEWETRVSDFEEFLKANGAPPRHKDGKEPDEFHSNGNFPIVNVTREEARQFCEWLTRHEREKDFIDATMEYRLPTDAEWSLAAGSPNLDEELSTPFLRHLAVTGVYPWVPPYDFPPPRAIQREGETRKAAGNLGDLSALKRGVLGGLKPPQIKGLEALGYDDGAVFTAPVGQYEPNNIGLMDLSGNVWEFVSENYGGGRNPGQSAYAVVRGGAWNTPANEADQLATQYRLAIPPDKSDNNIGFRVVLALIPSAIPPPVTVPTPVPVDPEDMYPD